MAKLIELEGKRYDDYVKNHPMKSHFLQSYAWGEFAKKEKRQTPYYLGLVDNNDNILGATLLLQKHLPLGFSYFYAPRGFVIDFTNDELVKDFSNKVVAFTKKKKSIFLKIDPDLIWHEENYKGELVKPSYDCKHIFNVLKEIGFKHQGFTKNFETMQPRYTFRIDLSQSMEEIESKFSKTVKQRIKKGTSLGTSVRIGTIDDIEEFSKLMDMTEDRKDFVSHDMKYYKSLYEIYNKYGRIDIMKKRLLFIICFVLLLTGCDVNYSVTINEDETFDEEITMSFLKTPSDGNNLTIAEDDKTPISINPNEDKFYSSKIIDKGNTYDMVYTYKHDMNSIKRAYFIANCFPETRISNTEDRIIINSGDGFACFIGDDGLKADSVKININTKLKVLNNNADSVDGNTYTWNINENNYLAKEIYFEVERVNNEGGLSSLGKEITQKNSASSLTIVIVFSIVIVAGLIYLFVRYKRNKNNGF